MEIINQGKQIEPLTFTCPVCGCKFKAAKNEYEFECFVEHTFGEAEAFAEIHCPNCGVLCVKKIGKVTE